MKKATLHRQATSFLNGKMDKLHVTWCSQEPEVWWVISTVWNIHKTGDGMGRLLYEWLKSALGKDHLSFPYEPSLMKKKKNGLWQEIVSSEEQAHEQ